MSHTAFLALISVHYALLGASVTFLGGIFWRLGVIQDKLLEHDRRLSLLERQR